MAAPVPEWQGPPALTEEEERRRREAQALVGLLHNPTGAGAPSVPEVAAARQEALDAVDALFAEALYRNAPALGVSPLEPTPELLRRARAVADAAYTLPARRPENPTLAQEAWRALQRQTQAPAEPDQMPLVYKPEVLDYVDDLQMLEQVLDLPSNVPDTGRRVVGDPFTLEDLLDPPSNLPDPEPEPVPMPPPPEPEVPSEAPLQPATLVEEVARLAARDLAAGASDLQRTAQLMAGGTAQWLRDPESGPGPMGGITPVLAPALEMAAGDVLSDGMPTETATMRVLAQFEWISGAVIETIERLPVMPTGLESMDDRRAEAMARAVTEVVGRDADSTTKAVAANELAQARQAAKAFWTVGDVIGAPPGALQRIRRTDESPLGELPFGPDWAQGVIERVIDMRSAEEDLALAFETRLGPEYKDAGWWTGLALSAFVPWEHAATAPVRVTARGLSTYRALRAAGVSEGAAEMALRAAFNPRLDYSELIEQSALREFQTTGKINPVVRERMEHVALTEDGRSVDEILHEHGYQTDEPIELREDLDAIEAAQRGATSEPSREAPDPAELEEATRLREEVDASYSELREAQNEARSRAGASEAEAQRAAERVERAEQRLREAIANEEGAWAKQGEGFRETGRELAQAEGELARTDAPPVSPETQAALDEAEGAVQTAKGQAARAARARKEAERQAAEAAARAAAPPGEAPVVKPSEVADEPDGFAARPVRKRVNREVDPRPDPPAFNPPPLTARQYWDARRAARDPRLAPLGYRLKPHDGAERIPGAMGDAPDDPEYVLRDAGGRTRLEGRSMYEVTELMLHRRTDGDKVFRQGSMREVARWNRTQRAGGSGSNKEPPVRIVADRTFSNPIESEVIRQLRKNDPRAIPVRLRAQKRAAKAADESAKRARQMAEEAAIAQREAAETAKQLEDALEQERVAERLVTDSEAQLAEARKLLDTEGTAYRAQLERRVAQLRKQVNAKAAQQGKSKAALAAELERKRARLQARIDEAEAEWRAAEARAAEAKGNLERLEADVASAKQLKRDARTLVGKAKRTLTAAEKAAELRAAEARAADVDVDTAAVEAAEVEAGRALRDQIAGLPADTPQMVPRDRVHELIRDAARLVYADASDARYLKLLPTGARVPEAVAVDIERQVAERLGATKLKNGQAYQRTHKMFVKVAEAGAPSLEQGVIRAYPGGPERQRAASLLESARRAGLTDAQIAMMTPAVYDKLFTQLYREAGGVYAQWQYAVRGMEPWVNRVVDWLYKPAVSSATASKVIADMTGLLGGFFTQPAAGLIPAQRSAVTRAIARLETMPADMIARFKKVEGTDNAAKMAALVQDYRGTPPQSYQLALDLVPSDAPIAWSERVAKVLARRDEITAMVRRQVSASNGKMPRWLDSDSDRVFVDGAEQWARRQVAAAADQGRDWIRSILQAQGQRVSGDVQLELQRIDPVVAARIYEAVFIRGEFVTPDVENVVAQLGPARIARDGVSEPRPITKDTLRDATFLQLLRIAGEKVIGEMFDDLVSSGAAVPYYAGPAAAAEAAGSVTMRNVLLDVVSRRETYRDPRTGAIVHRYDEGMVQYARQVLHRWGVEPGAGPNALAQVSIDGRAVTMPAGLAEMVDKAKRFTEDPGKAGFGVNRGARSVALPTGQEVVVQRADVMRRALPNPTQVWKLVTTAGVAPFYGLYNGGFFLGQLLGAGPLLVAGRGWRGAAEDIGTLVRHPALVSDLVRRANGYAPSLRTAPAFVDDLGRPVQFDELYDALEKQRVFQTTSSFELGKNLHLLFQREFGSTSTLEAMWWRVRQPFDWSADVLRSLSGGIEQVYRVATMVNEAKRGTPLEEAARIAADVLPNYHMLTDFEKQTLKWWVPFYAFMRKSVDAYTYALLTRPERVAGQARVSLAMVNSQFESDIEKGGLSMDALSRISLTSLRDLTDDVSGKENPRWAYVPQTGPVLMPDFFVTTGALLETALGDRGDSRDRVLGFVNPLVSTAAVFALDRTLTNESYTRAQLEVPNEVLGLPLLGAQARWLFGVGPRRIEASRGEDPRMSDPKASALMGGEPAVWAAGADPSLTSSDDIAAAQRNWILWRIWLGRSTATAHKAGITLGISPAPPELSWGQWVAAEATGATWAKTYREHQVMERYWRAVERAANERKALYGPDPLAPRPGDPPPEAR